MADTYTFPFHNMPANTVNLTIGGTTSHTVTDGYYARVVFSAWAFSSCNAYSSDTSQDHIRDCDSSKVTVDLWVDEGTSVSIGASGTTNTTGTTTTGSGVVLGISKASYGRITGNDVTRARAMTNITLNGVPSHTWTYETYGEAGVTAWIEEYPIQT